MRQICHKLNLYLNSNKKLLHLCIIALLQVLMVGSLAALNCQQNYKQNPNDPTQCICDDAPCEAAGGRCIGSSPSVCGFCALEGQVFDSNGNCVDRCPSGSTWKEPICEFTDPDCKGCDARYNTCGIGANGKQCLSKCPECDSNECVLNNGTYQCECTIDGNNKQCRTKLQGDIILPDDASPQNCLAQTFNDKNGKVYRKCGVCNNDSDCSGTSDGSGADTLKCDTASGRCVSTTLACSLNSDCPQDKFFCDTAAAGGATCITPTSPGTGSRCNTGADCGGGINCQQGKCSVCAAGEVYYPASNECAPPDDCLGGDKSSGSCVCPFAQELVNGQCVSSIVTSTPGTNIRFKCTDISFADNRCTVNNLKDGKPTSIDKLSITNHYWIPGPPGTRHAGMVNNACSGIKAVGSDSSDDYAIIECGDVITHPTGIQSHGIKDTGVGITALLYQPTNTPTCSSLGSFSNCIVCSGSECDDPCLTVNDCASNQYCDVADNSCKAVDSSVVGKGPRCTINSDCSSGVDCIQGRCDSNVECRVDTDCDTSIPGMICHIDPSGNGNSDESDNYCGCESVLNPAPEYCSNLQDSDFPANYGTYLPGEPSCMFKTWKGVTCCTVDAQCEDDEYCSKGAHSCNKLCLPGKKMSDGECKTICTVDSNCRPDMYCDGGKGVCEMRSCSTYQDCGAGTCCGDNGMCGVGTMCKNDPTTKCNETLDCSSLGNNYVCDAGSNSCTIACTNNSDCSGQVIKKMCNTAASSSYCVACLNNSDCSGGLSCNSSTFTCFSPYCENHTQCQACDAIGCNLGTRKCESDNCILNPNRPGANKVY